MANPSNPNVPASSGVYPLEFLDFLFLESEGPDERFDFILTLELDASEYSLNRLRQGAENAFQRFPRSGCRFDGKDWRTDDVPWDIETREPSTRDQVRPLIEQWSSSQFDLKRARPIQQLWIPCEDRIFLVTRMHHAIGDGLSLFLWMGTQLGTIPGSLNVPPLKYRVAPEKRISKNSESFFGKSDRLTISPISLSRPVRKWSTFSFPHFESSPDNRAFSNNDLICASLLEAVAQWNERYGLARERQRNSLLVPFNFRKHPFEGFGNASTRIRLYDRRAKSPSSLARFVGELNRQKKLSIEGGEWYAPTHLLRTSRLPRRALAVLLNLYANRPWADLGTTVLSTIERFPGSEELFSKTHSVELASQLTSRHPISFCCLRNQTHHLMTVTWNQSQMSEEDIRAFQTIFLGVIEKHRNEISSVPQP